MAQLTGLFSALSDPTRFAIVERLMAEGEMPVSDLLEGQKISAPAVSRHLKVLVKSGLVTRRASAQQRFYSVRPQAIETISAWTMSHKAFWQASLNRLEMALTQEMSRK